ncbi:50S ribosomal protein L17 [Candidatus Nomurabacteria bacterium RIFCSPLOWO2_01_FULL_36_10b]|uniref:Large ribosomal subunit protein bL17 n=1 Tax=Candidatus Nomurabacteria bacterium RIFCSPLOWO2_01_FULL_36_10b TaxID=1801766 RepID=A0A1F6WNZ3_9BACT|nr:MAG: 50S ribosomal protein L17 [Candidatus Nomurabacteria bacterium RIFCSPLOWO2_01_FULL_36_10b]
MRHHNTNKKLSRIKKVRVGLMRSLLVALIERESITTTLTRARVLRPSIEKLVTKARTNDLATRRVILARFGNNNDIVKILFNTIAPRYISRNGGYTRIVKLPQRSSDRAPMAIIKFV